MIYTAARRTLLAALVSTLGVAGIPSGGAAQALSDFCPGGDDSAEAAVIGIVSDAESGMILPGSEVVVSWLAAGTRQRVTVAAGLDGVYAVCGLPQGHDMQVRAMFGDRTGQWVDFSTEVVLQQHDLGVSLTGEQEPVELTEEVRTSRAFNATTIRAEDLAPLPEMTLYELLRQHQRLRFERVPQGEVIVFAGRGVTGTTNFSGSAGRFRAVEMLINERREADPVSAIRDLWIHDVVQIDILSAGEASARYGGDGWLGAIAGGSGVTRRRTWPGPGAALASALAVLAGCNPFAGPDPEVRLIVGSAHYEAGEAISFEIHNRLPDNARIPICQDGMPKIVLLRRVRGEWQTQGPQCGFAPSTTLEPGGRLSGTRPGVEGPGAEGLYALALHHDVLGPPSPEGRGFVRVISNSKPFQITD